MNVFQNKLFYFLIILFLVLSCKQDKTKQTILSKNNFDKSEKKPLFLDVNFEGFGEIKINRDDVDWHKIEVDSLITFNLLFKHSLLNNIKLKRSMIASRIPFRFSLKKINNNKISLSIDHLFNKVYTDSLIFSKKEEFYELDTVFNIYYGKVDGVWVCPVGHFRNKNIIILIDNTNDESCRKQ